MSDTLPTFIRIADAFADRVHGTTDWSAASPCDGWTARDVVSHVVANFRRAASGGQGGEPLGADEDPVAAFDEAYAGMKTVTANPEALAQVVPGPFGPMPFEQMIAQLMTNDVLIHTWDLAAATGQDRTLDAEQVTAAHANLLPLDAMIRMPGVFGPKLDCPDDADEQTKFLRFLGRPA